MTSRARLTWPRALTPTLLAAVLFVIYIVRSGGYSGIAGLGIANNALPLALAAVGETFVILTNGIDLSIGTSITLSNVTVASLATHHNWGLAVLGGLAVGVGAGLLNGLIVNHTRIAPLIATLATSSVFLGIALVVMPDPGGVIPASLSNVTSGSVGAVPYAAVWLAILAVLGWFVLRRTSFGIHLQALGGNESASWSAGIPVNRVRLGAYVASGLCSAIAGVVLAGLTQSGDPTIGDVYLLNAIAAVVVGGTSLAGGVGTAVGSVFGALVLSLVSAVLLVSGLSTNYQYVVTGAIVIGALLAHSLHGRVGGRRRTRRLQAAAAEG